MFFVTVFFSMKTKSYAYNVRGVVFPSYYLASLIKTSYALSQWCQSMSRLSYRFENVSNFRWNCIWHWCYSMDCIECSGWGWWVWLQRKCHEQMCTGQNVRRVSDWMNTQLKAWLWMFFFLVSECVCVCVRCIVLEIHRKSDSVWFPKSSLLHQLNK